MDVLRLNKRFCSFVVLIAVICIIQPVLAQEGTISISYRGAGGYYIGDSIIFDGRNTVGNTTVLKIFGPNLPTPGVPLYDLNGMPGTGTTVAVNQDGSWKFVWYSSDSAGIEKLVTARYSLTAVDLTNPQKTASTSILIKKPEFYINPQTSPVYPGDYVQLNGYADRGVKQVKIDISAPNGTLLHTYTSSVDGSGYFNFGFRADMQPGQYYVSVSNPSMKNILRSVIIIVPPPELSPVSTTPSQIPILSENVTVPGTSAPIVEQPVTRSPSALPLSTLTTITGLIIFGFIILMVSEKRRRL